MIDDVIRSLTISQRLLGTTDIVLIHHTRCLMTMFSDDARAAAPMAWPEHVQHPGIRLRGRDGQAVREVSRSIRLEEEAASRA